MDRDRQYIIRDAQDADWPHIVDIYQQGIDTGLATFESKPKSRSDFTAQAIDKTLLVAAPADAPGLLGWAVLWRVSPRACYSGVGEVSVYVAAHQSGKGIGHALLAALTTRSEELGLWTMQAAIFASNARSIDLHTRAGFRIVGRRERIAKRGDIWHDITVMERRSPVIHPGAISQPALPETAGEETDR